MTRFPLTSVPAHAFPVPGLEEGEFSKKHSPPSLLLFCLVSEHNAFNPP